MSKTIEIKKVHIRNLFLSVIVGFGILFGLEHFGTFRYEHSYTQNSNEKPAFEYQVPATTAVSTIKYETANPTIMAKNTNCKCSKISIKIILMVKAPLAFRIPISFVLRFDVKATSPINPSKAMAIEMRAKFASKLPDSI